MSTPSKPRCCHFSTTSSDCCSKADVEICAPTKVLNPKFVNARLEQQHQLNFNSNSICCSEKLDLAILNFFEQFRKIFIGDQVQKSSKVYKRMSELLGIQDETMWLNVVTSKIITNLKFINYLPLYIKIMGIIE